MEIQELINKINQSMESLDLISARKYIEDNIEYLKENKHYLQRNAREFLDVLLTKSDIEADPLSKKELNVIYAINTYATRFDVRALRFLVKNNTDLLMRKDIQHYLNADAKILLEGMCAIQVS